MNTLPLSPLPREAAIDVPNPLGIEGIKRGHNGEPLLNAVNAPGAVGIGALAVGDIKYKLQNALLASLLETQEPVYLDFRSAFEQARLLV